MFKIQNDYYVYEHIRPDNGTCFYVGKGRGKRAWCKTRNEHHDRIVNNVGMEVKIIAENLSEKEALDLERKTILNYLDNGYGIDITGKRKSAENKFLTNCTLGGDGSYGMIHTDEWCEQHSKDMSGNKNPAYGVNYWSLRSEEENDKLRKRLSNNSKGKNNPMYGISPKQRMDEETYKVWYQKRIINSIGSNNPNYGNDTLSKKLAENPELKIKYYSRPGVQNGRAREIYVYSSDNTFINRFDYILECAEWFREYLNLKTKPNTIRCNIITSITKNKLYRGYKFSYTEL